MPETSAFDIAEIDGADVEKKDVCAAGLMGFLARGIKKMSDSQFHRFCSHCGAAIAWERLLKAITSKAKVFFCSDLCRYADANAKNRKARDLRSANPNRNTCSACHGRGYTRVKRHQRSRNREMATQSEAVTV